MTAPPSSVSHGCFQTKLPLSLTNVMDLNNVLPQLDTANTDEVEKLLCEFNVEVSCRQAHLIYINTNQNKRQR